MRLHSTLLGALVPPAIGLVGLGCGGGSSGGGFVPPPNNSGTYGIPQREVVSGLTFPTTGPTQPSQYTIDRAFPGLSFSSPLFLTEIPDGSNRLVAVEQGGRIMAFPNQQSATQGQVQVFLDISARLITSGEEGLLGLAFAPDYATSGQLYVHYSADNPRRSIIARFRRSTANPMVGDPGSEEQVLVIPQPFANHNGGMLAFGPDGMLYISLGDGGSGGDPQNNGQDLSTLLGSMLRIDVRTQPYTVPADNPFVNQAGAAPEIWAYGLRHPWRFSFDRQNGELWVGDVGQGAREEISVVTPGANLGWRVYEGSVVYANPQNLPPTSFTQPVVDYDRGGGNAVIGGYVYRGSRVQSLVGRYLYADNGSGNVWLYDPSTRVTQVIGTMPNPSSFGEDAAGEVYLVSLGGAIYRVNESSGGVPSTFPQQLSQTGLFTDMNNLTPTAGLVEFDVNVSFWSDGARKRRWLALPGTSSAQFASTGPWSFPQGTVIVKHFEMDLVGGTSRRLETRVLINEAAGWAGYTYVWNANQTDATLDPGTGTTIPLQVPDGSGGTASIVYPVPSRAQCMTCHNQPAGTILGLRTEQMNRDFAYAAATDNQLRALGHVGLITPDPVSGSSHPALPRIDDISQPLELRAKAYLSANCSQCHQPGAVSPVAIDLRYQTGLAAMGLVNQAPTSGDLGLTNAARIRSGSKESSVLWERIRRRDGTTQMPPIATNRIDQAAVDLIGQWIDGM